MRLPNSRHKTPRCSEGAPSRQRRRHGCGERHRFVTNLSASNFAVYEDGQPQEIFAFVSGAQPGPPLHVGVLLDVSGSQGLDLKFTQSAVIKFLESLPDAVDVTFIDFASHVRGGRYAQSDFPRLVKRVRELTAGGETALTMPSASISTAPASRKAGRSWCSIPTAPTRSSSLSLTR